MKHSILFLSAFAAIAAHATLFRVSCDQPDAKYRLGEIATFTCDLTITGDITHAAASNG